MKIFLGCLSVMFGVLFIASAMVVHHAEQKLENLRNSDTTEIFRLQSQVISNQSLLIQQTQLTKAAEQSSRMWESNTMLLYAGDQQVVPKVNLIIQSVASNASIYAWQSAKSDQSLETTTAIVCKWFNDRKFQ